jgi:hypothetical protein
MSDQSESKLDRERLKAYFDSVELVEAIETATSGKVVRRIEIYQATNYKGRPYRHRAASVIGDL